MYLYIAIQPLFAICVFIILVNGHQEYQAMHTMFLNQCIKECFVILLDFMPRQFCTVKGKSISVIRYQIDPTEPYGLC